MVKPEVMAKVAEYAFVAFVIIAIVVGLALGSWARVKGLEYPKGWDDPALKEPMAYATLAMLILGIIVGLVSITIKEITPFLIAAIAIAIAAMSTGVWAALSAIDPILSHWAHAMLNLVWAFVAPAAVISAVKAVYAMAKGR